MKTNTIILFTVCVLLASAVSAAPRSDSNMPVTFVPVSKTANVVEALAILFQAHLVYIDPKTHELKLRSKTIEQMKRQGAFRVMEASYASFCY